MELLRFSYFHILLPSQKKKTIVAMVHACFSVGLIKICVRVLCNGPLETGHLRLTCPFTECKESGLWSKVASCRESLGTSNQPSRQAWTMDIIANWWKTAPYSILKRRDMPSTKMSIYIL